ncbi:hypothetical protein QCA50_007193 [Cerrena zonata]|uniref:Uncharacterized protein n=1 Tax=Cerrena zonata TaxID=2478898 RepID=A0AAW0GIV9_9APHY
MQLLAPSRSKIADQLLSNESRTSQPPQVSDSSTASLFGSISTSTSSTQGAITTPSTLPTSIFQESPGMSTTTSVVSASTSPPDLLPDRKPSRFGTADILAITFGIVSLCLILFILFGMIKRRRQGMSSDQRRRGPGNDPERSEVRMPVDLSIFKPPLEEVSEGSEPSNHSTREEESTRTTEVQPNVIEPPLQSPRSRLQNILVQTALVVPENATPHSPSLISNRTRTTVRTTPPQYEESLASNEVRLAGGPVVRMGRAI